MFDLNLITKQSNRQYQEMLSDLSRSTLRSNSGKKYNYLENNNLFNTNTIETSHLREHSKDVIAKYKKMNYEHILQPKRTPDKKDNPIPISDQIHACQLKERMTKFSSMTNLKLDPRDQKIRIPFQSSYCMELQKSNYTLSYEPFQDQIRDWLIDVIQIVTSISFNQLKRQAFTDKQAKNFAAKNILLNIKQLCQVHCKMPLQQRLDIINFINNQSYQIFGNVIQKYPQSASKGASKRVKSRIQKIDNRESDQFDFLFRNGIQMQHREDGDYTEDIMKILNKLISFASDVCDPRDSLQQSNYQVFSQIMEYIFENTLSSPATTAKEVVHIICNKMTEGQAPKCDLNAIFNDYDGDLMKESKKSILKDQQKTFLIGHKIPTGTRLFSQQQIEGGSFKVHDSSILRILTKWTDQLRNKLANADESIYRRLYKFKNSSGKFINLESDLKGKLYQSAIDQLKQVDKYLQYLKQENIYLQTLFSQQQNIGKYCKNDIKVGVFAAKVNQIGSQYIFKYLNRLIHALMTVPKKAAQDIISQHDKSMVESVNLVSFKVGDLMRCKCSCSQIQFMKILAVLQQLHQNTPDVLKIVRIKNRMEQKDNDILINLFFLNKAQCELQLSIIGTSTKNQKDFANFNHFLYQIVRADFGPISELATIVAQYDPLTNNYSKNDKFSPELIVKKMTDVQNKKNNQKYQQRIKMKQKLKLAKSIQLPFVCCNCQHLAILSNPHFYFRDENISKRVCNDCRLMQIKKSQQKEASDYMLNINFTEAEDIQFFKRHLHWWNNDSFIQQAQKMPQDQISVRWVPKRGFLLRRNQKLSKWQLFTSIYDPVRQFIYFGRREETGECKILTKIEVNCQKKKRIASFKKQFKKFFIFQFTGTDQVIEDSIIYLKCNKKGCCGLKRKVGLALQSSQILEKVNQLKIQYFLQNQKNLLEVSNIPSSFDKLDKLIGKIKDTPKQNKIRNTIQAIEANKCQLTNILTVGQFKNLIQLNISNNPSVKSLDGLQSCQQLKFLDCKKCDLINVNELTDAGKLQYLNISNNTHLTCIKGLSHSTNLLQLYLANTQIQSLQPITNNYKLQSLDLQGCQKVRSVKPINSQKLTYINIVDCIGLQIFDLPPQSVNSLKNVELYKQQIQKSAFEMVFSALKMTKNESSNNSNDLTLQKINSILQLRKTNSLQFSTFRLADLEL